MTDIPDEIVERALKAFLRADIPMASFHSSWAINMRAAIAEAVKAEREACLAYLRSIHHDATADLLARARGEE